MCCGSVWFTVVAELVKLEELLGDRYADFESCLMH